MMRKLLLTVGIASLMAPFSSLAQPESAQAAGTATPYRSVPRVEEDRNRVLVFFSLSCPVCGAYHDQTVKWSRSLPNGWTAEFVPVVEGERGTVIAARAIYAARAARPSAEFTFMSFAYSAIQDRGMAITAPKTWEFVASSSGVTGFDASWRTVSNATIQRAFNKLVQYRINATPSIAIGGRYVITPDDTNGDAELFFKLANGMVSKAMSE